MYLFGDEYSSGDDIPQYGNCNVHSKQMYSIDITEPVIDIECKNLVHKFEDNFSVDEIHTSQVTSENYKKEELTLNQITPLIPEHSFYAEEYFDSRGGHLILPGPQVYLTIPPGAIAKDNLVAISLCATYDSPNVGDKQDFVPVSVCVTCGPNGCQFQQSVILSYPHCIEEISSCEFKPLISSQCVGEVHDYRPIDEVPGASVLIENQSVTWLSLIHI